MHTKVVLIASTFLSAAPNLSFSMDPRVLQEFHTRIHSLPADDEPPSLSGLLGNPEDVRVSQYFPFQPSTMLMTTKERGKKRSARAARMGDDLLVEFISRLPTKSLSRFKCVSKSWCSFISRISAQRKSCILLPVSGFFICPDSSPGFYVKIAEEGDNFFFESRLESIPFQATLCRVIHSCNGLLLFAHRQSPCLYYVYNPTSMEFVSLPEPRNRNLCCNCYIAFDPRDSPYYKVVRFTSYRSRIIIEIYSSQTEHWDECSVYCEYPFSINRWDSMSVFRKGFLHILTQEYLVRYDIENGSFHRNLLPERRNCILNGFACIGVSRGQLYYAVNYTPKYELLICMLDDRNYVKGCRMKWLPVHKISTEFLDRHPLMKCEPAGDRPCLSFRPIAFHPQSEIIYLSTPSKILLYQPSNSKLDEVCKLSENVDWTKVFSVAPCFESINPPGSKFIGPSSSKYIM